MKIRRKEANKWKGEFQKDHLVAETEPENAPSQRVLEKAGFIRGELVRDAFEVEDPLTGEKSMRAAFHWKFDPPPVQWVPFQIIRPLNLRSKTDLPVWEEEDLFRGVGRVTWSDSPAGAFRPDRIHGTLHITLLDVRFTLFPWHSSSLPTLSLQIRNAGLRSNLPSSTSSDSLWRCSSLWHARNSIESPSNVLVVRLSLPKIPYKH